MKMNRQIKMLSLWVLFLHFAFAVYAFEGQIGVETTRGGQTEVLLYTVGISYVRVEITNGHSGPTPVDILDAQSGQLTLLFPQNRTFVRLPSARWKA